MSEGINSIAEDVFESRLSSMVGKPVRHGFNADRDGGDTFVSSDVTNFPVIPFSWDQLEVDATLVSDELTLSEEKIEETVTGAYLSVVKYFHGVVDDSVLLNIFPGIDLNDPESYNFEDAAIKTIVLPDEVYQEALHLNNSGASLNNGVTYNGDKSILVNMTRKSLIVVRDSKKDLFIEEAKRIGVTDTDELNKYMLESCVIHETIHKLEAQRSRFSAGFREGNIDLYSKLIILEKYKGTKLASIINDDMLPGYASLIESSAIMHEILLSCDLSMRDIQRIFLGYDRTSENLIQNLVDNLGGRDLYYNLSNVSMSQEERLLLSRDLYFRKFQSSNVGMKIIHGLSRILQPMRKLMEIESKPVTAINRLCIRI